LVLIISGIMTLGLTKMMFNFKLDNALAEERSFNHTMRAGIEKSFIDIIEAYKNYMTRFHDYYEEWGIVMLKHTSPLPVIDGDYYMLYKLDKDVLSDNELKELQDTIVANFQGACILDPKPQVQGNVKLFCPLLKDLKYRKDGSERDKIHDPGTPIDPEYIPTVVLTTKRENPVSGTIHYVKYAFTMDETYHVRRSVSIRRLNAIRVAMESFHNKTLMKEVANSSSSGGLNSMDDAFVPWIWKAFGDDFKQGNNTFCDKGGSTRCANFDNNTAYSHPIWRQNATKGTLVNRLISNIFGDKIYTIDGFGNPIYIYPFINQCKNSTFSSCSTTSPTLPQDNYIDVANTKPPFVTAIYTPHFDKKDKPAPEYGRVYVVY